MEDGRGRGVGLVVSQAGRGDPRVLDLNKSLRDTAGENGRLAGVRILR